MDKLCEAPERRRDRTSNEGIAHVLVTRIRIRQDATKALPEQKLQRVVLSERRRESSRLQFLA